MENNLNRRAFLQSSMLAGAGLAVPTSTVEAFNIARTKSKSTIRLAVLGSGMRGQSHIDLALNRDDCEVTAIADIQPVMIEKTKELFKQKNKPLPKVYDQGERDYLRLLEEEDVDAVLIATPWRWHTEMITASMRAGKYVGSEVCGGFSLDECWDIVRTHEETGKHLFCLENVCYRRDVMAVLNMVRQNLLGELLYLEGGYQHDLRGVKFNDGQTPYDSGVEFGEKGYSEAYSLINHQFNDLLTRSRIQFEQIEAGRQIAAVDLKPLGHFGNIGVGTQ